MKRRDMFKRLLIQQAISAGIGFLMLIIIALFLMFMCSCKMMRHEAEREIVKVVDKSIEEAIDKKIGNYVTNRMPWVIAVIMTYFGNKFRMKAKNGNGGKKHDSS